MTDSDRQSGAPTNKPGSLWAELGPAISFVVVYNLLLRLPADEGLFSKDTALYWATGVLMVATLGVVGAKLVRREPIPPFLIVSSTIIGLFGAIGIAWQSKTFLFIKPTIINLIYAGVIFGGLAVGRNIWRMLFQGLFDLPEHAWRTLAIRWGLFFIVMALWNEYLWRFHSEAVWANWKLGNMVIVMAFALANTPYTLKHLRDSQDG